MDNPPMTNDENNNSKKANSKKAKSSSLLSTPSLHDYLLLDYEEEAVSNEPQFDTSEVKKWLDQPPIPPSADPLIWWKSKESEYPTLSSLAKIYLAIPAASTPSERVFSHSGDTITKKRCKMEDDQAAALMFLYENSHHDLTWYLPHWTI